MSKLDSICETVSFNVTVDTDITPPIFIFYNSDGEATNGSVTFKVPEGSTTQVIYNLTTSGFTFVDPIVTNNFDNDTSYAISDNNQTLTITDDVATKQTIGLQLVVENSNGQKFASPDPRIKNRPSNT